MLRGDRLVVDLTTGVSRVESGKNGGGRVQGLFQPGSAGARSQAGRHWQGQAPRPVPARPPN